MRKQNRPKLCLSRETILSLHLDKLGDVGGGNTQPGDTLRVDLCNTKNCPETK